MSLWNDSGRSRAGYLKGEIAMAREDTERSVRLAQAWKATSIPHGSLCRECAAVLPSGGTSWLCRRCRNRALMKEIRKPRSPEQHARELEAARVRRLREAERTGNERRKRSLLARQAARVERARAKLLERGIIES